MISELDKRRFDRDGYLVARGLFDTGEAASLRDHFTRLREAGEYPGDVVGVDPSSEDPLRKYPRMIHMHRWDQVAREWLLDPRLAHALTALLGGVEPFAVQTMLYFKPPGARGQAVHQDQFYLQAQPGTCMAGWMALDPCDEENGCLEVVPGSHVWPILCTVDADTSQSFTDVTVPLPDDAEIVPVVMEPGDVLFFNGSLVHGSKPNRSAGFGRALVGHYVQGRGAAGRVWYHPATCCSRTAAARAASGWSETGGRPSS